MRDIIIPRSINAFYESGAATVSGRSGFKAFIMGNNGDSVVDVVNEAIDDGRINIPIASSTNIYNTSGVIEANRSITGASTRSLTFSDLSAFNVGSTTSIALTDSATNFITINGTGIDIDTSTGNLPLSINTGTSLTTFDGNVTIAQGHILDFSPDANGQGIFMRFNSDSSIGMSYSSNDIVMGYLPQPSIIIDTGIPSIRGHLGADGWEILSYAGSTTSPTFRPRKGTVAGLGGNASFLKLMSANNVDAVTIDNANDYIGIFKAAPAVALDVVGDAAITGTSITFSGIPTHADDAAAGGGGLTSGEIYQTATGELRIKT